MLSAAARSECRVASKSGCSAVRVADASWFGWRIAISAFGPWEDRQSKSDRNARGLRLWSFIRLHLFCDACAVPRIEADESGVR